MEWVRLRNLETSKRIDNWFCPDEEKAFRMPERPTFTVWNMYMRSSLSPDDPFAMECLPRLEFGKGWVSWHDSFNGSKYQSGLKTCSKKRRKKLFVPKTDTWLPRSPFPPFVFDISRLKEASFKQCFKLFIEYSRAFTQRISSYQRSYPSTSLLFSLIWFASVGIVPVPVLCFGGLKLMRGHIGNFKLYFKALIFSDAYRK